MVLRLAGCALAVALLLPPAQAREVGGIVLPARITVADTPLVLNGAGVRHYFVFEVYVGALYLEEPSRVPGAIIGAPEPKCIYLHFLRDVSAETIADTLLHVLRTNVDAADYARLESRIARLRQAIPDLHAGDRVRLVFPRPGRLEAWVNGERVAVVPGRDFQAAVLRFWLGEQPVDERLKQALLGTDRARAQRMLSPPPR